VFRTLVFNIKTGFAVPSGAVVLGQGTLTIFDKYGEGAGDEIFFDNVGQMLGLILNEYKSRVRERVPTAKQRLKNHRKGDGNSK